MADDMKPSGLDFGAIIAFVAPGFFAFRAIAYQLPTAAAWLTAAADKEQSVGVFLFVLLASLALGLVVSGIRALLIDAVLGWSVLGRFAVRPYAIKWASVKDGNLVVLVTIRDNFYRYYQFYANAFVALCMSALARWRSTEPALDKFVLALLVVTLVVLLLSARQSLQRYSDAVTQLFSKEA